jgi:hypothetical protein
MPRRRSTKEPKRTDQGVNQPLTLYGLGTKGVNVDAQDVAMDDQELRQAQNAINNSIGSNTGISSRPGMEAVNTDTAAGAVLGGIGVPLADHRTGQRFWFIGRDQT